MPLFIHIPGIHPVSFRSVRLGESEYSILAARDSDRCLLFKLIFTDCILLYFNPEDPGCDPFFRTVYTRDSIDRDSPSDIVLAVKVDPEASLPVLEPVGMFIIADLFSSVPPAVRLEEPGAGQFMSFCRADKELDIGMHRNRPDVSFFYNITFTHGQLYKIGEGGIVNHRNTQVKFCAFISARHRGYTDAKHMPGFKWCIDLNSEFRFLGETVVEHVPLLIKPDGSGNGFRVFRFYRCK